MKSIKRLEEIEKKLSVTFNRSLGIHLNAEKQGILLFAEDVRDILSRCATGWQGNVHFREDIENLLKQSEKFK